VNSHGLELDVAGRVDEHWSLTASYVYDDARIVNGQGPNNTTGVTMSENGNWLQDVPRNAGSLWLKYDATGQLRGLSAGGGIVVVGVRQGDNQNDFQLPGYTRFDAMIMYKFRPYFMPGFKNLTAQLNVRNLFNTVYYQSSSTNLNIFPGAPRTVLASLRAEW
jgi:iron complex outermembrane receptor protein